MELTPPAEHRPVLRLVGRRIAELRRKRSLTQDQLAERAWLSLKYVQRIEGGRAADVRFSALVRIADALRTRPAELFRKPKPGPKPRRGAPPKKTKRPAVKNTAPGARGKTAVSSRRR